MRLDWAKLVVGAALPEDGSLATLEGAVFPTEDATPGTLLLVPEEVCCLGCRPDPLATVEVLAAGPLPRQGQGQVRVEGRWRALPADDPTGWRWQLGEARVSRMAPAAGAFGLSRRGLLAAPLVCVAALPGCATAEQPEPVRGRALVSATAPMDLHSHAGRVMLSSRRGPGFAPLAGPMREGGMAAIALAMVADSPFTRVTPDNRIEAFREPVPGQLRAHGEAAFARLAALVAEQGLAVIRDQAGLRAASRPGAGPSVIVAAEGADFLDGRLEALGEAFHGQALRHLQLVHYRVNELGDIQTAAPRHDGLTEFGAAVVRDCNRLGVVVDVAHGTFSLVRRVAEISTRPIVLSHTALTARPGPRSRWITADHARLVAATGGVIGIWPLAGTAPTMRDYAASIGRMVDAIGIDHVGIGSDMQGLLGTPAFGDYRETPALAEALLEFGFKPGEAAKVLGGNYARVLGAVLPA